MSQFSDVEERFITANQALISALHDALPFQERLEEAMSKAEAASNTLGQSMPEAQSPRERSGRTRDLLLESAQRAGFDETTQEFQWVIQGYEQSLELIEMIEQAEANELLNGGAVPTA